MSKLSLASFTSSTAALNGSSRSAFHPIRKTRATWAVMDRSCTTLAGHVNKPGCVELPLGVTVRELIDKHGGGVWKNRKAKGCNPGGLSMGLMTEAEFDTPLDFNGPAKVGCLGLGTAAVTVFDEETSIVDVVFNICRSLRP
ncbi:MAG: hypothetical protein KatS3mg105_4446 [Gemmatales bacterium]|nr:MAG: hypothetical protein KatS3mg105_4446 [Gemmatales bacterium]